MTIFTDKDGTEFEEVDVKELSDVQPQDIVIRPVKQQPKWEVNLLARDIDENYDFLINTFIKGTEDQAQLIKEAVEALMVAITENPKYVFREMPLHSAINEARQSMRENN